MDKLEKTKYMYICKYETQMDQGGKIFWTAEEPQKLTPPESPGGGNFFGGGNFRTDTVGH